MPTPQRLPIVNSDDGVWGDILRQYLLKEHYDDGTDNAVNGGHKTITIRPGTASAGTAPLKFTTGTLLTAPEAGAMEFAGDNYYLTDTSGPTRRKIAAYDDTSGATGDIYYRNSSGYFTRLGIGSAGDLLTVSGGIPSWSSSISNASTITLKDTNFTLQDNSDTSKQLNFELSSISASTTRTLTVPDASTTIVGTDTTQTLTNKTLTSPTLTGAKSDTIKDTNGNNIFGLIATASAVNYLWTGNAVTGDFPKLRATGSDTDVSLGFRQKGTGIFRFQAGTGEETLQIVPITSAVNSWRFDSSTAGNPLAVRTNGTDTDISINFLPKGAGNVQLNGVPFVTTTGTQTLTNKTLTTPKMSYITDTNGNTSILLTASASAVNFLQVVNSAAGSPVILQTNGSDTNIGFSFRPRGTGTFTFNTSGGANIAAFSQGTSPVNYFYFTPGGTGVNPQLATVGTDTNIGLNLVSKGTGTVQANGNPVLSSVTAVPAVTGTPSSSNYLRGDGTWATPSGGSGGMLAPVQGMTLGSETFTISSGTVTQISGTTINGYTPAIGDRILVANAPATTGTGSSYSMTSQPTNGIYVVTGNTTNLTVSRASDMSGSVKPGGLVVYVENASWPGSKTLFFVETPNDLSSFTWGTNNISWKWSGGLSGQQQQIWLADKTLSLNIWNGTGWSKYVPSDNAGTQTLTMPATATSDTIVGRASTDTLTNKRVTSRVGTTTSSATPTINTDNYDIYGITAQAADITSFTTNLSGTPTNGQTLWIYIVGTASRAITWGASFENGIATLPATTTNTERLDVEFMWNAVTSKWRCMRAGSA
jgi:hypothetical protein